MKAEHFIYGLFNGVGTKIVETDEVSHIITKERFDWLIEFARKNVKQSPQQIWLPEGLIACVSMERAVDEHGRNDIYLHCILIPINDWLEFTQPLKFVKFMQKLDKPPKRLELLEVS
jgi:hypothetical protein